MLLGVTNLKKVHWKWYKFWNIFLQCSFSPHNSVLIVCEKYVYKCQQFYENNKKYILLTCKNIESLKRINKGKGGLDWHDPTFLFSNLTATFGNNLMKLQLATTTLASTFFFSRVFPRVEGTSDRHHQCQA